MRLVQNTNIQNRKDIHDIDLISDIDILSKTHGLISTFPSLPMVLTSSARTHQNEIKMKHNFFEHPTLIFLIVAPN